MDLRVSVCIPVFRGGGVLARCLDSLLAQEDALENAEVIVADNHSDDDSLAVAERALAGLPNVRIVQHPSNLGRVENWNACLKLARGEWIKFLMVNDVLLPGSLRALLAGTSRAPDAVMVASRHRWWDGKSWPLDRTRHPETAEAYSSVDVLRVLRRGGDPFWALNGSLLRRAPIEAAGLRFDVATPYLADKRFCLRLSQSGSVVFLATDTYAFNQSAAGRFYFANFGDHIEESRRFFEEVDELAMRAGDSRRCAADRTLGVALAAIAQSTAGDVVRGCRRALRGYGLARVVFEVRLFALRTGVTVIARRLRSAAGGLLRAAGVR